MKTGYELTYSDFVRLLSYPAHREHVAPLVRGWFGYEVQPTTDGFTLRDSCGVEVHPKTVHDAIQANGSRQFDIYQTAMSLWR